MADVILFDFFGTLVTYESDRTAITYERTHALLAERGATFSHHEFVAGWELAWRRIESGNDESLAEHSMHDVTDGFLTDVGLDLDPSSVDLLIEVFLSEWIVPVTLVPGADDVLRRLAEHHRLGVVSNTHDPGMVPALLNGFGIVDCFEHVLLSVDHGFRKPHPSIYQAALDRFECAPADALFVGDSYEADFRGPIEAGLDALLIDPDRHHDVPDDARLDTVLDLLRPGVA